MSQQRTLLVTAIASGVIAVLIVVSLFVLGSAVRNDVSNTTSLTREQNISGCRALADANVRNSQADFLNAIGDAIDTPQADNRPELDKANAALKLQVAIFRNKIIESQQHPDQFLAECHAQGG